MNGFSAVLLLAVAGLTNAYLDQGVCPDFQNIAAFVIPSYMGRWFEAHRFQAGFEDGMTCATADYAAIDDTTISVTNSAVLSDGTLDAISGTGSATGVPGQLIVQFPGEPVGFYNVLATDYETYSSVYSCRQIGDLRDQYAWVMSRTEELDADSLAAALDAFESNGIDTSLLQATPQGGDCIYAPVPPKI
ncbi:apolipoprotein D-like [Hyalella azteca]|uniref:Apolipoprotein D-like n=1 Tax=Hyalella azteca TaxID=294128 RepID=A0A8B7NZA9_HYAAZ|nr:apolipoprotein D-like [Hyalella azteca]